MSMRIAVASGKGGTGKTSVVASFFALAERHRQDQCGGFVFRAGGGGRGGRLRR
jgi:hypothetical protein